MTGQGVGSSGTAEAKGKSVAQKKKPTPKEEKIETVNSLLRFADSKNIEERSSTIYHVPDSLRALNHSSFNPRVVSIGPMHKGRANLKVMQDKKASYLAELLAEVTTTQEVTPKVRSPEVTTKVRSQEDVLTSCETKVRDSISKIRRCYLGENFNKLKYNDNEFVKLMIVDACFILQFINKLLKPSDVIYNNTLHMRAIAVDLVLLENQIPFFVLQDIYDLTLGTLGTKPTLIEMLRELLDHVNPFIEKLRFSHDEKSSHVKTHNHILGVLHDFYQPDQSFHPSKVATIIPTAHSVVELHEVGVRFKPNKDVQTSKQTSMPGETSLERLESGEEGTMKDHTSKRPNKDNNGLMAMEFEQSPHNPTLRIPGVRIDKFFEVIIMNLIAYEQGSTPVKNYVTSYAMAMEMLAATPEDIAKLTKSNIIHNNLGSNERASNMISSICKNVTFPDFYYTDCWDKQKKYYDGYLSKNLGVFKQDYCSDPWKALALFVGTILFFISLIQFIFRMGNLKPYHS